VCDVAHVLDGSGQGAHGGLGLLVEESSSIISLEGLLLDPVDVVLASGSEWCNNNIDWNLFTGASPFSSGHNDLGDTVVTCEEG